MHNPNQQFPGHYPYPYQPMPVPQKYSFVLALSAGISGALGIILVILILSQMVTGSQGSSNSTVALQEIMGFIGLLLVLASGGLATIGIARNQSRAACIAILAVMAFPIMISLFLLTVLVFTFLGIG